MMSKEQLTPLLAYLDGLTTQRQFRRFNRKKTTSLCPVSDPPSRYSQSVSTQSDMTVNDINQSENAKISGRRGLIYHLDTNSRCSCFIHDADKCLTGLPEYNVLLTVFMFIKTHLEDIQCQPISSSPAYYSGSKQPCSSLDSCLGCML